MNRRLMLKQSPLTRLAIQLASLTAIVLGALWALWLVGVDANAAGQDLAQAASRVKPYRWAIAIVRWGVWVMVWLHWERIGQWLIRDANLKRLDVWRAQRRTVMRFVVILELVIVISFVRF